MTTRLRSLVQDAEICAGVSRPVRVVQHARTSLDEFVEHYNHEHRHAGIGLHTPADIHFGLATETAKIRSQALAAARQRTPARFATTTDPKILDMPGTAWINEPQKPEKIS